MEESIVERVLVLIKDYGLTASEFADKIDVQRSSMSHLVSGRNKPSLDFIQKILNNFSDINPTWLIMGSGPMKQLDLFDIKGDVAPIEPIVAEKFNNTEPSKTASVVEQTSIKQSFHEIAAPQQEPVVVTYAQSVPVVELVSIPYIQREKPVFVPASALTAPIIQSPVEPIAAQVIPAQEPLMAPIAPVIPPVPVQPPVVAPIADIPTPQVAQSAHTAEKSVQNDKKVTKIVFFYSDNSFESFNPQ